jgi:hypothetical protein
MERENMTSGPTVGEAREQLRGDIEMVRQVVSEKAGELRDSVHTLANEHPLATVGMAFGVGFLLAGGLYSKTTARLLGLGGRLLVGAAVRSALATGGLGLLGSLIEGEQGMERDTTSTGQGR